MMQVLRLAVIAGFLTTSAFCANIGLPFNTGVDASGAVLGGGSADPHYADTTGASTYVLNSPPSVWLGPDTLSAWIGPDTVDGSSLSGGQYTLHYQTTFDLTGYDPSSVVLTGRWSADNIGVEIFVNGVSTGNIIADEWFGIWNPFTISNGFTAGVNTLDFEFTNTGGPGGLRVEFDSATGNSLDATAVPEPGSILLMGIGISAIGLFIHRRKQKKAHIRVSH